MIEDNNLDQYRYLYDMASLNDYERYAVAKKHWLLPDDGAEKKPLEIISFTITIDQRVFDEMMKKVESQSTADSFYHTNNSNRYKILANGF